MNTIAATNWDEDVQLDAAETYQALVRSLDLTEGFGIFLVRCVEGERDRLMQRLQQDLPKQQMAQLKLETALEDGNLYNLVAAKLQVQPDMDVLFIDGLEKSFEAYIRPGYGGQGDYYKMDSVPRVLGHLNLQRERFRNDFPVSLVFFLSPFGLKYMARRSPDFFDWRSGIFEFVADRDTVAELSQRLMAGDYEQYLEWTHQQRFDRIREIHALLEEDHQTADRRASLAFEQGNIFYADQNYEAAIASYDQALQIKPDYHEAWYNRGSSLAKLGQYETAIASFDQALQIKQDDHNAWSSRGISLAKLGQYETAIASFDQVLQIKPDYHEAWYNRGNSLDDLGQYETAIASFDQALQIKQDYHEAWSNRGISLAKLGQYETAIASFDQAITVKSDNPDPFYNRACAHSLNRHPEAALQDLATAIRLAPEEYRNLAKTDTDFDGMRDDPRFQALLEGELSTR
jgi:tetratricopeptide (TPR) repeat protein